MLEGRWVSSSKEIIGFRRSLLNPVISYQFQRFVSVKSDLLENDVLFWRECQKYKVEFADTNLETRSYFLEMLLVAVL